MSSLLFSTTDSSTLISSDCTFGLFCDACSRMLACCWVRLVRLSCDVLLSILQEKTAFPCPAPKSSALMVAITVLRPASENSGQVRHPKFAHNTLCT